MKPRKASLLAVVFALVLTACGGGGETVEMTAAPVSVARAEGVRDQVHADRLRRVAEAEAAKAAEAAKKAAEDARREADRIRRETERKLAQEAHKAAERASRTATAQKPAAATQAAPAASSAPAGSCGAGKKTRAHAEACYGHLLAKYNWSYSTALSKMMCESDGDPTAVGPPTKYGRAQGLMQILPGGSFDPATNIAQAWKKYSDAGGWSPWQC